MAETLTTRLQLIKNDVVELVNINEINAAFDKIDNNYIPTAELLNTTTHSIPVNVTTKMAFNVINFDSYATNVAGAMANVVSNDITIRKTGVYNVSAYGTFDLNGTGIRRVGYFKNGATQFVNQQLSNASYPVSLSVSKNVYLVAGDVIAGSCYHTANVAINITNNGFPEGCGISVSWLGSIA